MEKNVTKTKIAIAQILKGLWQHGSRGTDEQGAQPQHAHQTVAEFFFDAFTDEQTDAAAHDDAQRVDHRAR